MLNIVREDRINLSKNQNDRSNCRLSHKIEKRHQSSAQSGRGACLKLEKEITKILFDKGYILNYKFVEDGPQGTIKIALKYDPVNKVNAIKKLIRVSTPGLRQYTGYKDMPRVLNGLGMRSSPPRKV